MHRVVNTSRFFRAGGPTHLSGRKYVCEPCAADLGRAVGLVDGSLVAELQAQVVALDDDRAGLLHRVSDLSKFHELAERLLPPKAEEE